MPDSLADLERQPAALPRQISELEDFRAGSITGTGGRGGSPARHCHLPDDPGHHPHPRLTHKVNGKTVTESFAMPGEQRKAEWEIKAFRRYRQLERSFIEVIERICRVRPVKDALTAEGKKGPRRSRRRSREVTTMLGRIFAGRKQAGGLDLKGVSAASLSFNISSKFIADRRPVHKLRSVGATQQVLLDGRGN